MEQVEFSCVAGRNAKCYSTSEKCVVVTYIFKYTLAMYGATLILSIYPNKMKTYVHIIANMWMLIGYIHNCPKLKKNNVL